MENTECSTDNTPTYYDSPVGYSLQEHGQINIPGIGTDESKLFEKSVLAKKLGLTNKAMNRIIKGHGEPNDLSTTDIIAGKNAGKTYLKGKAFAEWFYPHKCFCAHAIDPRDYYHSDAYTGQFPLIAVKSSEQRTIEQYKKALAEEKRIKDEYIIRAVRISNKGSEFFDLEDFAKEIRMSKKQLHTTVYNMRESGLQYFDAVFYIGPHLYIEKHNFSDWLEQADLDFEDNDHE